METWDVDELLNAARLYFPTSVTKQQIEAADRRNDIGPLFVTDAVAQYEEKEVQIGAENLRQIERRVMLSVIDQHWREHLYEMDYLQEGINLRAMGQRDPLTEWQREGYDMFTVMMSSVEDDFVRYVFRLQVVKEEAPAEAPRNLTYSAPEDPVQGSGAIRGAAESGGAEQGAMPAITPASAAAAATRSGGGPVRIPQARREPEAAQPVRVEKTPGRNDPCFCGSGKKYKLCHGR